MANVTRTVRQWLETDAAFGVTEVPLPSVKKAPRVAPSVKPDATAARPQATPVQHAIRRPTAAPTPAPARSIVPRPEPAKSKAGIVLPAAPAGLIAELPALTRKQKEKLLDELRCKTEGDCASFINEISTRLVFGEGDPDAVIMFIGEGPGIEEDRTGRPFVGRSGQLLDKMINAMGFKRDPNGAAIEGGGVYIANVVKLRCADPDESNGGRLKDRPPTPEEAARGLPVLHQQIEIIRPRVIVTLGAPAVKYVTGTTEGVMKLRGKWLSYRGVPVMPTYHPSFLLRAYTLENRQKVWSDLQQAMKRAKG